MKKNTLNKNKNYKYTLIILKLIAMGEEDIKNKNHTPQDEFFEKL